MARIRRLRKVISDTEFKDTNLRIYDPYLQVSIVPSKTTFSGEHGKKVMVSIGRRYNDRKAGSFFDSDDPLKKKIVERMSKELKITRENIIKAHKTGKLKDLLIDAVALQVKHLGIPVIIYKKRASYELFEYMKSDDPHDILRIVYATLQALGAATKMFETMPDEKLIYYKVLIEKNLEKFLRLGYRQAEKNDS